MGSAGLCPAAPLPRCEIAPYVRNGASRRGDILKCREGKGRRVTRLLIEEGQLMLMTAADNHCVKQRALIEVDVQLPECPKPRIYKSLEL